MDKRGVMIGLVLAQLLGLAHGDSPIRVADSDEFPFQVSIRDLRKNDYLCSGVLITNKTVLTPASCVPPGSLVKVSAGSIYRKKQNRTVNFEEIIVHSKYNSSEMANDIAIIKVADAFKTDRYVAPAMVPLAGSKLANRTHLSGWNLIDPDDALKVYDNYTLWRDCKTRYNLDKDLGPDEFCGDFILGPDYGSLISQNGVVYGLETDASTLKRMQSYVEISVHADWIREKLGREASEVKWYQTERNEAGSASNCMAAMLLFAVFLCQ